MDPLVVYWEEEKSCSKGEGQCYPILYSALEAQVQAAPKSERINSGVPPEHPRAPPEFEKGLLKI